MKTKLQTILSLVILLFLLPLNVSAQKISEGQAMENVRNFLNIKATGANKAPSINNASSALSLAYQAKSGEDTAFYVFNIGEDDGFVIGGGDEVAKEILAYVPKGHFDYENAPENAKWLLDQYSLQIQSARSENDGMRLPQETESDLQPIEPLLTTQWNQGEPYNNLCPSGENGKMPVGCVPVAIAQIVNYHQWPETGDGSYSYDWNNETLSYDFGSFSPNWERIANSDNEAISELAYSVAVGCNTGFNDSGSGSGVPFAKRFLIENFRYNNEMEILSMSNFYPDEWENVIYDELSNKRPVYIQGGNHAFVCDGYLEDHLFHFNWGWGGVDDGYFSFSALTPGDNFFSINLLALTNINKRENGLPKVSFDIISTGNIKYNDSNHEITCGIGENHTVYDFSGFYGVEFINTVTGESTIHCGNYIYIQKAELIGQWQLTQGSGLSLWAPMMNQENIYAFSSDRIFCWKLDLTPGEYDVYPIVILDDNSELISADNCEWKRLRSVAGGQDHLQLTVTGDYEFLYSNPGAKEYADIEFSRIELFQLGNEQTNDFYAHESFLGFNFEYTNKSPFPSPSPTMKIYFENDSLEYIDDSPFRPLGANTEYSSAVYFQNLDLPPGRHRLELCNPKGENLLNEEFWFELKKREYDISVTDIYFIEDVTSDNGYTQSYFGFKIQNHSDQRYAPILKAEYISRLGERTQLVAQMMLDANSEGEGLLWMGKEILQGNCEINIYEPYGRKINQQPFTFYNPLELQYFELDSLQYSIRQGETQKINVTFYPEDADDKTLTWESSDENIVSVDDNGVITGVSCGLATITVRHGTIERICYVKVTPALNYKIYNGTSAPITGSVDNISDITVDFAAYPNSLVYIDANTTAESLPANFIGKDDCGEWYADEIRITDRHSFYSPENITAKNVSYTRNFNNTEWQPLYVPFNMSYGEWADKADVAEVYNVRGYDNDGDGVIDETVIEFNKLNSGEITPNVPYVIRAKNVGEVTFECTGKTLFAAPAEEGTVECSSTKMTYSFHGVYQPKTDMFSSGAYHLSGGAFHQATTDEDELSPNRFYLKVTPKDSGYTPSSAPQKIRMSVNGDGGTSSIEGIEADAQNDDVYYDLTGRRVVNPAKGIYIRNGKKVFVK